MNLFQKKFLFVSVSLLLYVAALFIPGYEHYTTWTYGEVLDGWQCLSQGFFTADWTEKFGNPFPFISWLSNLPFYIGLIILLVSKRFRGFRVSSDFLLVALLMSFGSLICYGNAEHPFFPRPGCIVWIFSQFMLFTGAFILKRETPKYVRVNE